MSTLLLLVIYMAFIGLGLPDSLFGAAWPSIYPEFGIPVSSAACVTMLVPCGTVVSSLLSSRLIGRFGTNKVTAFSTALTALALLGYSLSGNLLSLCLFAIPLGLGAGAVDTALNNYVALHYSAVHMSLLHCFYGIGVSLSPYILSLVISAPPGWRGGYGMVAAIQAGIALVLFVTLPLWSRVRGKEYGGEAQKRRALSLKEVFQIPGVKGMCALFIFSCGIECTCGNWGSTFLVECRNMEVDQAARIIMYYYIGMALGRLASGLLSFRFHSWKIIRMGQWVLGAAALLLLIPGGPVLSAISLFLIGFGNGPLFPNFNFLTPENFGADRSQSVIGVQMAMSYIGIMLVPAVFGLIGQNVSMGLFPVYLLLFFILMMIGTVLVKKTLKAEH